MGRRGSERLPSEQESSPEFLVPAEERYSSTPTPPDASKAFFRSTPPALVEDSQPDNYGGDGALGPARLRFPTVALLS